LNILGIDISSKAIGLAVVNCQGKILRAHTVRNPLEQDSGEYYKRIRFTLEQYLKQYGCYQAVIEDINIRFLGAGKKILPIHGVVKEICYSVLIKEPIVYNVSTYRFEILGISRWKKKEKDAIEPLCKTKKEFKRRTHIKLKVIDYVNKRLGTTYQFQENDEVDAIALALAYIDDEGVRGQ